VAHPGRAQVGANRSVRDRRRSVPEPGGGAGTSLEGTVSRPTGTGKSQTIANIIGDHLARGERVLMVCDKRTALDVVYQRLDHMGLGHLCAIIHDAHADRRRLYMSVRDQLEAFPRRREPRGGGAPGAADRELQTLHQEYLGYLTLLSDRPSVDAHSFSELAGEWLVSYGSGLQQVLLPEETSRSPPVKA